MAEDRTDPRLIWAVSTKLRQIDRARLDTFARTQRMTTSAALRLLISSALQSQGVEPTEASLSEFDPQNSFGRYPYRAYRAVPTRPQSDEISYFRKLPQPADETQIEQVYENIPLAHVSFRLPDSVFRIDPRLAPPPNVLVAPIIRDLERAISRSLGGAEIRIVDGEAEFGSLLYKLGKIFTTKEGWAAIVAAYYGVAAYPDFREGAAKLSNDIVAAASTALAEYAAVDVDVSPAPINDLVSRIHPFLPANDPSQRPLGDPNRPRMIGRFEDD